MAHIGKRELKGGRVTWDVQVRVRGSPPQCKSFRTRTEADAWASLTEAAAHGRTLAIDKQLTLAHLLDEATPKLKRPVAAALHYWRKELGTLRLRDVTPPIIARHRDLLTGAPTRANGHKRSKPRTDSTVELHEKLLGIENDDKARAPLAMMSAAFARRVGLPCDDETAYILMGVDWSGEPIVERFHSKMFLIERLTELSPFRLAPMLLDDDVARRDWEA